MGAGGRELESPRPLHLAIMSIRPERLIAAGLLAIMVGEATAQAGGSAVGASPIPGDVLSNTAAATTSVAVAAAIGMWLSSHTTANH